MGFAVLVGLQLETHLVCSVADLLGKQAIEHKSGIEIEDKSGSEEVGVIVGEEPIEDTAPENKKARA